eukprot:6108684-Heterocapsa_arctica.AAC.1
MPEDDGLAEARTRMRSAAARDSLAGQRRRGALLVTVGPAETRSRRRSTDASRRPRRGNAPGHAPGQVPHAQARVCGRRRALRAHLEPKWRRAQG